MKNQTLYIDRFSSVSSEDERETQKMRENQRMSMRIDLGLEFL